MVTGWPGAACMQRWCGLLLSPPRGWPCRRAYLPGVLVLVKSITSRRLSFTVAGRMSFLRARNTASSYF